MSVILLSGSKKERQIANEGVTIKRLSGDDIKEEHWDYVHDAMEQVVHSIKGTARRINKDIGYRMAGKTGTAQVISIAQDEKYDADTLKERQRDQALFVGFAPVKNPQVAISVLVENSGHGGEQSAPVARLVLDAYFKSEAKRVALVEKRRAKLASSGAPVDIADEELRSIENNSREKHGVAIKKETDHE